MCIVRQQKAAPAKGAESSGQQQREERSHNNKTTALLLVMWKEVMAPTISSITAASWHSRQQSSLAAKLPFHSILLLLLLLLPLQIVCKLPDVEQQQIALIAATNEFGGDNSIVRAKRQTSFGGSPCISLTIPNGIVNYLPSLVQTTQFTGGSVAHGTSAVLTCNAGFYPSGSSSSTCQNGVWTPALGSCLYGSSTIGTGFGTGFGTGINPFTTTLPFGQTSFGGTGTGQCTAMLNANPLAGTLNYSQMPGMLGTYAIGTSVTLTCNYGSYAMGGSTQATCTQFGWQPTSLGQCQSSSGTTGFGGFGTGTTTGFGIGYGGFGTGLTTNGCLPAAQPLNGQIVYGGQQQGTLMSTYPSGSTATVICNSGGTPNTGQTTSVCNNGIWNPTPATMCSTTGTGTSGLGFGTGTFGGIGTVGTTNCAFGLLTPLGATIQYYQSGVAIPAGTTTGYPSGTTAQLLCQQGQLPTGGISTWTCRSGQWVSSTSSTTALPGCSTTGMTPSMATMGTGSSTNSAIDGTNSLQQQQQQCNIGVSVFGGNVLYLSGTTTAPSIAGGQQVFGPPYAQGTVAQVQCANGQLPSSGMNTVACIGGQWQPSSQLGQCMMSGQQTNSFLVTGGNSAYSPYAFGGMSTQNPLFLPATTSPTSSSLFSTTMSAASCLFGVLPPLNGQVQYANGQLLGPFPAGSSARLVCNQGFLTSGQTTAICQNGQFQPTTLGTCTQASANPTNRADSSSTSSSTSRTTTSRDNGTTQSPTTTTTNQCIELPTPRNGRFVYSPIGYQSPYPMGATVTLVCAEGARLADGSTVSHSAICTPTGWSQLQFEACQPGTDSTTPTAARSGTSS